MPCNQPPWGRLFAIDVNTGEVAWQSILGITESLGAGNQKTGLCDKDGFVIWTLFHEIGHVLNDPRGEMHLEYSTEQKRNTAAERAANAFAMEILFGDSGIKPFEGLTLNREIADTARQVGVAPGVAVHQMHRKRLLDLVTDKRNRAKRKSSMSCWPTC